MELKDFSTRDLVEELSTREGVSEITVTPEGEYSIYHLERRKTSRTATTYEETGPARILVVVD